jgi:hypothetical protein
MGRCDSEDRIGRPFRALRRFRTARKGKQPNPHARDQEGIVSDMKHHFSRRFKFSGLLVVLVCDTSRKFMS